MSDFEDMLGSVLSDPQQMEKLAGIARSIMGGDTGPEPQQDMGIDMGLVKRISGIMNNGGDDSPDRRLLEAMRPFLSEKRRSKMDKAVKLARMARLATLAANELGGEEDV